MSIQVGFDGKNLTRLEGSLAVPISFGTTRTVDPVIKVVVGSSYWLSSHIYVDNSKRQRWMIAANPK
jgi:hypothetical protein